MADLLSKETSIRVNAQGGRGRIGEVSRETSYDTAPRNARGGDRYDYKEPAEPGYLFRPGIAGTPPDGAAGVLPVSALAVSSDLRTVGSCALTDAGSLSCIPSSCFSAVSASSNFF